MRNLGALGSSGSTPEHFLNSAPVSGSASRMARNRHAARRTKQRSRFDQRETP